MQTPGPDEMPSGLGAVCGGDGGIRTHDLLNVNYSSIKPDAVEADLYAVGVGLAGLQKNPVAAINRVNTGTLVNQ